MAGQIKCSTPPSIDTTKSDRTKKFSKLKAQKNGQAQKPKLQTPPDLPDLLEPWRLTQKQRPRPCPAAWKNRAFAISIGSRTGCVPGGVLLQPENVLIVWRRHVESHILFLNVRNRARIAPTVNLCVTIGERKAAGGVVVARRKIHNPPTARLVGITCHVHDVIAVVDTVLPLVHQHKRLRRPGVQYAGLLQVDDPSGVGAGYPGARIIPARTAHPVFHRHTPNPGHPFPFPIDAAAPVRRAVPDSD